MGCTKRRNQEIQLVYGNWRHRFSFLNTEQEASNSSASHTLEKDPAGQDHENRSKNHCRVVPEPEVGSKYETSESQWHVSNVEGVYSLVEVGQVSTGLIQQVSTPGEHGQTPEPGVETVDYAGKECHLVVEYLILQPASIDVRYTSLMLL